MNRIPALLAVIAISIGFAARTNAADAAPNPAASTPMLGAEQRNAARTDPVGEAQAEPAPGRDAAQRRVPMILTVPRTARDQHVASPALAREDRVQWTCLGFQPHSRWFSEARRVRHGNRPPRMGKTFVPGSRCWARA